MGYHLTMLAHDMNGGPLPFGRGQPQRLRNEARLGFERVNRLAGLEFVASFADVARGHGGYNQDHELFGYRQAR